MATPKQELRKTLRKQLAALPLAVYQEEGKRAADHIAAFIEADRSIRHGITSSHLVGGRDSLLDTYSVTPPINGFPAAAFFKDLGAHN